MGVVIGLVVDQALGDKPLRPHPVAVFGSTMNQVEKGIYRDHHLAGLAHAAIGIGIGVLAGKTLGRMPFGARLSGATVVATYIAVAGRSLGETAEHVGGALVIDDLDQARFRVKSLVGRSTGELNESEVARAVVESVAENTVDAIVAPAMWAVVGGAPGVFAHRAINTLDAMVGYRSPRYLRFGWASARLDDVAAWLPARVTALLVMLVRPRSASSIIQAVRRDAPYHPSPNSGVAEAAFAAALGVRLGGVSTYGECVESRPLLGVGDGPVPVDIDRAVRLSRDVSWALVSLFSIPPFALWLISRLRSSRMRRLAA